MTNKSRYPDRKGVSAYGGDPNNVMNAGGCSAYERAYCIETRAENEPETLMTDVPGILVCPACGFKLNWGDKDE